MNMNRRLVGATLASTAAALFATSAIVSTANAQEVTVKCYGSNACKGNGACKSALNGCKGKNACKGKSFEQMPEKACIEKLGRS